MYFVRSGSWEEERDRGAVFLRASLVIVFTEGAGSGGDVGVDNGSSAMRGRPAKARGADILFRIFPKVL